MPFLQYAQIYNFAIADRESEKVSHHTDNYLKICGWSATKLGCRQLQLLITCRTCWPVQCICLLISTLAKLALINYGCVLSLSLPYHHFLKLNQLFSSSDFYPPLFVIDGSKAWHADHSKPLHKPCRNTAPHDINLDEDEENILPEWTHTNKPKSMMQTDIGNLSLLFTPFYQLMSIPDLDVMQKEMAAMQKKYKQLQKSKQQQEKSLFHSQSSHRVISLTV